MIRILKLVSEYQFCKDTIVFHLEQSVTRLDGTV